MHRGWFYCSLKRAKYISMSQPNIGDHRSLRDQFKKLLLTSGLAEADQQLWLNGLEAFSEDNIKDFITLFSEDSTSLVSTTRYLRRRLETINSGDVPAVKAMLTSEIELVRRELGE